MTETQNNSVLLPEGFENARADASGAYFRFAEGSTLQGILLGRFPKPGRDQTGFIYQIETTTLTDAYVRNPDEESNDEDKYIVKEVEVGTVVSIDEKASLKGLKALAEDDKTWEVFIRCLDRKTLPGGRSFWDCVVGKKEYRGIVKRLVDAMTPF